ncbi:MAG: N-acetyltransferase [Xanthobacteraceae bacterium]|nr:MAG: N-acetyltransferase [Xanthobacteraceae bacterium]
MTTSALQIDVLSSVDDLAAVDWDGCAAPAGAPFNPFVSHAFFHCLEQSGSAAPRTGWTPRHVVAREAGRVIGLAPCYLKSHSRGEYVFDYGWAEAYERAGGRYYPKLQVSVPFTPATGPRLCVRPDAADAGGVRAALAQGLITLCRTHHASSVHATFLPRHEWQALSGLGFLPRTDQQFHWDNAGYGSFDDFLAALAARHRKAIRRERREALQHGVTIHQLTGDDITEDALDAFFAFYMETGSRKWGRPYLTRAFYTLVGEHLRKHVLLVMARRDGRWIAGAINFIGSDTLFGRHWGALEHHPFLHFEVCYYQAIDFAIRHGLAHVEAGAQGEHKIARGYRPRLTYSAHYIADPALRRAVADYLARERAYVALAARELTETGPFRRDGDKPAGPS